MQNAEYLVWHSVARILTWNIQTRIHAQASMSSCRSAPHSLLMRKPNFVRDQCFFNKKTILFRLSFSSWNDLLQAIGPVKTRASDYADSCNEGTTSMILFNLMLTISGPAKPQNGSGSKFYNSKWYHSLEIRNRYIS